MHSMYFTTGALDIVTYIVFCMFVVCTVFFTKKCMVHVYVECHIKTWRLKKEIAKILKFFSNIVNFTN